MTARLRFLDSFQQKTLIKWDFFCWKADQAYQRYNF